ncbi:MULTISPECIES: ribonuclease HII [unclassified Ruegeria]|uniref:ribonuclease HII n=1 Tax=unclassified Ruegeria TaxID=2625375 RepID=UPI001ADD58A3|nr:ribonuclease HII [Ruegeria sp. R8_1]MBO9416892.1 ribonuclease HII [Ruegeria sp. R8_2]
MAQAALSFLLRTVAKHGLPERMTTPNYDIEQSAKAHGYVRIAGVDEVGRGPLAGPVVAAAVILNPGDIPQGLNDSKKLTDKRRAALDTSIRERAEFAVAQATVAEIDTHNILRASHIAMERAVAALDPPPDYVLIDGNMIPRGLTIPAQAVVKGDGRSVSIAAASILAKNWRDQVMVDLAQQHPGYGWESNAGYPTKMHREALRNLGVTPHHRRSFKPVHNILYQE